MVTAHGSGYGGYADRYRLLGIEVATGAATEIDLPTDVYGAELVCMTGSDLVAAQAIIDDTGKLTEVRVMKRAATLASASWQPLTVVPLGLHPVSAGSLSCIEPLDELVLAVAGPPNEVFTFDSVTGSEVAPIWSLPGGLPHTLGAVDETALALAYGEGDQVTLWRRPRSAPWEADPRVRLRNPVDLVVLEDLVVDVTAARALIGPDRVVLTEVDL